MSASIDKRWEFLDHVDLATQTGCLLEFDKGIAASSGCLACASNPISIFPSENEWTLPSFVRGKIERISTATSPSGTIVPHVKIAQVFALMPSVDLAHVPTRVVLDGAALVGMLTSTHTSRSPVLECLSDVCALVRDSLDPLPPAFSRKARAEVAARAVLGVAGAAVGSVVLLPLFPFIAAQTVVDDYNVGILDPEAIFQVPLAAAFCVLLPWMKAFGEGPDSFVFANLTQADAEAQRIQLAKQQARAKQMDLASAELQKLDPSIDEKYLAATKDLTDKLGQDPKGAVGMLLELVGQYFSVEDQAKRQTEILPKIVAHNQLIATFLDGGLDEKNGLAELYGKPLPYTGEPPKPFQCLQECYSEIWEPIPAGSAKAKYASRAWAKLDILRILFATTRLVVALGMPDVGKSNFLEKVFGITSKGSGLDPDTSGVGMNPENRTSSVSVYRHPSHSHSCNAYVVDCPGYGDNEEERSATVCALLLTLRNFPAGATQGVWLLSASRNIVQAIDDLLPKIYGVISLIVVTHLDSRIGEMHTSRLRDLPPDLKKKENSEKANEWIKKEEREIMKNIQYEVNAYVKSVYHGIEDHEVKEPSEPPDVVYACLGVDGWLCTGERDEFVTPDPPKKFQHTLEEVIDFFHHTSAPHTPLLTAGQLRDKIDRMMGLPVWT